MTTFVYGDAIAISGGTYKGKTGTFLRYAGLTRKSCCIRINGDNQNERTIRLKSITATRTTAAPETIQVDAEAYNKLVEDVAAMAMEVELLRDRLINLKM